MVKPSVINAQESIKLIPKHLLEGKKRLTDLQQVTFAALGLHLCGALVLYRGLSQLSGVQVIRSSYFHIIAFALQGLFSTRVRWSRGKLEKGVKEFKNATKEAHKKHPEDLSKNVTNLFNKYGEWVAYGLKYGENQGQEAKLAKLAEELKEDRIAPLLTAAPLTLLLCLLFSKRCLPISLWGLFTSASLEVLRSAKKDWKKLHQEQIREALSRIVTLTGKGKEIAHHLRNVRLKEDNSEILENLNFKKVKTLSIPTFPKGVYFPLLTSLKVGEGDLTDIAKHPLTKLKIKHLSGFDLPPTLQVLDTSSLPWSNGNPFSKFEYLTEVNLQRFSAGSGRILSGLRVLQRLHVKEAKTMASTDLLWLSSHQQIEEVKIKGVTPHLYPMVETLPPSFLVFVKGQKEAVKRDKIREAWAEKGALTLTFKI